MSDFNGEYVCLKHIGSGGFAEIKKCYNKRSGYIRAIKTIKPTVIGLGENEYDIEKNDKYQKFEDNCKRLLKLGHFCHPNMVHIYRFGWFDDLRQAFVEMDYIKGDSVENYLRDNESFVPIDEVLCMVRNISSALAYCHVDVWKYTYNVDEDDLKHDSEGEVIVDKTKESELIEKYGVVHNDIHSGNVMRREDGSYVLIDFGLAFGNQESKKLSSNRREAGVYEYMAPEKFDSQITMQSDVYSFGILMYEFLTGHVPFVLNKSALNTLDEANRIMKCHKEKSIPCIFEARKKSYNDKYKLSVSAGYVKDYPDWLEKVILKCLEKKPEDRFANGKELYKEVERNMRKCDEWCSKLQELRDYANKLKEENEKLKRYANKLKEENEKLENDNKALKEQINKLEKEARPSKSPRVWMALAALFLVFWVLSLVSGDDARPQKAWNEQYIDSISLLKNNYEEQLQDYGKKVGDLNRTIAEQDRRMRLMKANNGASSQLLKEKDEAIDSLNAKIDDLNGQFEKLEKSSKSDKSDIAKLNAKINQLKKQLKEKENYINTINEALQP